MKFRQNEGVAERRRFPVWLILASDGKTPALNEAGGQPQVSKNFGPFANSAGTLVSLGNGDYYLPLTQDELNTPGRLTVRYQSAACLPFSFTVDVDGESVNIGSGANAVVVTVQNAETGQPVPNVLVIVRNELETSVVAWSMTDANGEIPFNLDNGTYHILIRSSAHYEPIGAQVLVVDGPETPIYQISEQASSPPHAVEGLCRVTMRVVGLDAQPVQNIEVRFQLQLASSAEVAGDVILTFFDITAKTNAAGQLVDPKTGEIGALILRSDAILPHVAAQDKRWKISCAQCRFEILEEVNVDNLDLGVKLVVA